MYRALMKEMRLALPAKPQGNSIALDYLRKQFKKHMLIEDIHCKAKQEMSYLAHAYLTYLQSSRRYAEIQKEYTGKGERTVKQTADMVGFKLPNDPK